MRPLYGIYECARFGVVRRGGWCDASCLVVAACPCVWLVAGLCVLVVDEEVVIHKAVVGCLLCFLCIHLDAVLHMCVRSPDGGEFHVTYCGPRFWGVIHDDPVELEWRHSPEHRFLHLRLLHQGSNLICRWRGRAPSGELSYGVLWRPCGQVVASLGQWALFEVFPHLWLLEMAWAYGVFRGYVCTPSAIPACHPV